MRYSINDPELVRYVNEEILQLTTKQYVPLGPDYACMSREEAQNNLVMHRMAKNFEEPDDTTAALRKEKSLQDVKAYDQCDDYVVFQPSTMELPINVRRAFYEIRNDLRDRISGFVFSVRHFEISNGETFESSNGDTSVYRKLQDRDQIRTTRDNFDNWCRVTHGVLYLKRVMKRHYFSWWLNKNFQLTYNDYKYACDRDKRQINALFADHKLDLWKSTSELKSTQHRARAIWRAMMWKVTIIEIGARFTTVPKNNDVDRVIECECLCNMVVQRIIAKGIRKVIEDQYGVSLNKMQHFHKILIRHFQKFATIDLKNASNSVYMSVLRWFLHGSYLLKMVESSRSAVVDIDGEWIPLKMVAPMGNGFTFELMTLMLLAMCRHFDNEALVYGDDIIVTNESADEVICALSFIGFTTNVTKTFVSGTFRESCGGFTSHGKYLTSFEFEWAPDLYHTLVNINKLRIVMQSVNDKLKDDLTRTYNRILSRLPLLCMNGCEWKIRHVYGRAVGNLDLTSGVPVGHTKLLRLHKSDEEVRAQFQKLVRRMDKAARKSNENDYQLYVTTSGGLGKSPQLYVRADIKIVSKTYKFFPTRNVDPFWAAHYMYGGRVCAPIIRKEAERIQYVLCSYHSSAPIIK